MVWLCMSLSALSGRPRRTEEERFFDIDSIRPPRKALSGRERSGEECGWVRRACACAGCAALAEVAVYSAHSGCQCLFQRAERVRAARRSASGWRAVGGHLARTLHANACLLLATAARRSPCRQAVWQAQQCLQARAWAPSRGATCLHNTCSRPVPSPVDSEQANAE